MYAVLSSVKISTCLTLPLCLKYGFKANEMGFSSFSLRTFISFLFKELYLPPIRVFLCVAPHPCSLASVRILHLTDIFCYHLFLFMGCFNSQCYSAITEMLRCINGVLCSLFFNLSKDILYLSNFL